MSGFCAKEFELPRHNYEQRIRVLEEMIEFEQRYDDYIVDVQTETYRDDVVVKYYLDYGEKEEDESLLS